jgi:hypothetical protein
MANGHGGKRAGAGRKPDDEGISLRNLARDLCTDGLKEMARLALEAESESVRAAAFDRLFRVAYGKELSDDGGNEPLVQIVRWARNDEEATPDPAREHSR